jgi:hypothetical protein
MPEFGQCAAFGGYGAKRRAAPYALDSDTLLCGSLLSKDPQNQVFEFDSSYRRTPDRVRGSRRYPGIFLDSDLYRNDVFRLWTLDCVHLH